MFGALGLGFVAYGLSIWFYIRAQRHIGAARTSAYYALSPFIGAALSLIALGEPPTPLFWIALAIMALGTVVVTQDSLNCGRRFCSEPFPLKLHSLLLEGVFMVGILSLKGDRKR